jgi:hypothetical protein
MWRTTPLPRLTPATMAATALAAPQVKLAPRCLRPRTAAQRVSSAQCSTLSTAPDDTRTQPLRRPFHCPTPVERTRRPKEPTWTGLPDWEKDHDPISFSSCWTLPNFSH